MGFNIEAGLAGAATGFLGGYSTLLQDRMKRDSDAKKEEALLQREKQMAKYKQDLLKTSQIELSQEKRAYEEDLAKRTGDSGYVTKTGVPISNEDLKGMDSSSLLSRGDYNIGMKEKENSMALDQAAAVTKRKYETTKGLVDAETEAKVDQTLLAMKDKLGIPESQMEQFKEIMILEGADTPSKLAALMTQKEAALTSEERTKLLSLGAEAKKQAEATLIDVDTKDILKIARSKTDYTGNSREEAIDVLSTKAEEGARNSALLFLQENSPKSASPPLSVDKKAQVQEGIKKIASAVQGGQLSMEEVESRYTPQVVEAIRLASGNIVRQEPSNEEGPYSEPIGPTPLASEQRPPSLLEMSRNPESTTYKYK